MMIISFFATALLILFMMKAHRNTHRVNVNEVRIHDKQAYGSENGQYLRVLHLSDLHLENISVSPEELYETLSDKKIDLIALTGDFLDRKRSISKLVPYLKMLNKLNATFGMYAVFGNHDYVLKDKDFAAFHKVLKEHGCRTLQNENDTIFVDGMRVNIIGIDDNSTNRSDVAASYAGMNEGYQLVLTHDPNIVLDMAGYDYDYLLAGHFHGGQIHWPKPYHLAKMGRLVRMNMIKGLHYYDGKPFYISEGLGQTGVNIRVGSRPEITLHELYVPRTPSKEIKTPVAV